MSIQILPITNDPNQNFQSQLSVDDKNLLLEFDLRYNEIAGYWVITITDPATGTVLLDSTPLLVGIDENSNILSQLAYLNIGSFYLLNMSGTALDVTADNLGVDYQIVWGDTPSV